MALTVRQPTNRETPDSGQGGQAVTGVSNTGHSSTVTASAAVDSPPPGTPVSDSDSKSARWFGLQEVSGQKILVKLKFTWSASGAVDATGGLGQGPPQIDGSASSTCSFQIQYSLNGGSNWTTHVSDSASASSIGPPDSDSFTNNGSADITLGNGQDVSQIQVRCLYQTGANAEAGNGFDNATANASVTATISGIQVEVTTADPEPIILW